MKKNVAGQKIGCQMVSASDGSAFTGSVTVYVTGDAGTQAVGSVSSGACTHEGNGYHTYAPAQAETNYDLVAFTFVGTGAIPATIQVFTGFPQTGDSFARLGAPAGASISADIGTRAPASTAQTLTPEERNSVADALLDRANAIEAGLTVRGAMRLGSTADAGKLSGASTPTITIRNVGDTKARITATVDADGNRTAVTTDVT